MSGPLAAANSYRFSSKEYHENTGLYYYGFRYYEPNLQRWINQDPIGEAGGLNLYGFVGNDPVNGTDAWGLYDFFGLAWYFDYAPNYSQTFPSRHQAGYLQYEPSDDRMVIPGGPKVGYADVRSPVPGIPLRPISKVCPPGEEHRWIVTG